MIDIKDQLEVVKQMIYELKYDLFYKEYDQLYYKFVDNITVKTAFDIYKQLFAEIDIKLPLVKTGYWEHTIKGFCISSKYVHIIRYTVVVPTSENIVDDFSFFMYCTYRKKKERKTKNLI